MYAPREKRKKSSGKRAGPAVTMAVVLGPVWSVETGEESTGILFELLFSDFFLCLRLLWRRSGDVGSALPGPG